MEFSFAILLTMVVVSTLQESSVSGELTVVRGPAYYTTQPHKEQTRSFTCVSEDDSSALVWNQELNWSYGKDTDMRRVLEESSSGYRTINCPLYGSDNCINHWSASTKWHRISSLEKAMGPIMDRRWEDLEEISFIGSEGYQHVAEINETGAISFSIRGTIAILLLCENASVKKDSCLRIELGRLRGAETEIEKYIEDSHKWEDEDVWKHTEPYLSPMEWRTFTLKMDESSQTVAVYDMEKKLSSFKSTKRNRMSYLNGRYLYVGSPGPALYRFHTYEYLHTTTKNETLLSPKFHNKESNICIEMLIGLCVKCSVKINMLDGGQTSHWSRTVNSEPNSKIHGLPMWRHVRLNESINVVFKGPARLQFVTVLQQYDSSPLWALANVQTCKEKNAVRESTITISQKQRKKAESYIWSKISCQKLSYEGGSLVNATSVIRSELEHVMPLCPSGKVGPNCNKLCSTFVDDPFCKGLAICIDKGCMCPGGWQGDNCDEKVENSSQNGVRHNKGTSTSHSTNMIQKREASSKVLNLRYEGLTDRSVILKWDPPKNNVDQYIVTLELENFSGCTTQPSSVARDIRNIYVTGNQLSLTDLHPYSEYFTTVTAFPPGHGSAIGILFRTKASKIPTSVVSNLMIKGNNITWEGPEDCTTISGPFNEVKLVFQGKSRRAENHIISNKTNHQYYGLDSLKSMLYGATEYSVRVYITRGSEQSINETAFRELRFTTDPRAPPKVKNLDIFETNFIEKTVLVRWLPPEPPRNGDLEYYELLLQNDYRDSEIFSIPLNKSCELWSNYICYTANIDEYTQMRVRAKNKNVMENGNSTTIKIDRRAKVSEHPENLTVEVSENGVVTLEWSHPWKTNSRLKAFKIRIEVISSDLLRAALSKEENNVTIEYPVKRYQLKYNQSLHLLPSTSYNFYVAAVTSQGLGHEKHNKSSTTHALKFSNIIGTGDHLNNYTIQIHLPSVSNVTVNSTMHVVVKGIVPCEFRTPVYDDLINLISLTNSENAWIAATLTSEEIEEGHFIIGNNKPYNGVWNCQLKPGETYDVVVVVQDGKATKESTIVSNSIRVTLLGGLERMSLAWLISIPIIAALALLTCYLLRKRTVTSGRLRLRKSKSLPQNTMTPEYLEILPTELSRIPPPNSEPITSFPDDIELEVFRAMNWDSTEYEYVYLVQVQRFEEYVEKAFETGFLVKQFSMFPRGQTKIWEYGKLPQNRRKNQYGQLIAYDETRVILKKLPGQPYSDYINANYIGGYDREKAYIATQGTNPHTVIDFWRMVWQEGVHVICLLCNVFDQSKKKFKQYWPEVGSRIRYGDVVVFNAEHKVYADYTFRTFHVTHNQLTREIKHLHYTAWQNHESLMYSHSLVPYLRKLVDLPPGNGPVVIQSTAGIGRAGVIILCDICLRRAAVEGVVDVVAEMKRIRRNRANMVDNNQQYLLAHLAIAESLHALQTTIPCDEDLPTKIHHMKQQSASQLERLQAIAWYDKALNPEDSHRPLTMEERDKNRYPELAPDCNKKVTLKRYEFSMEGSDYISAVYVDGFRLRDQYVATQVPLPSTRNDFWRMILEQKVELIVILQSPDPEDDTCCEIVEGREFNPLPFLKITAISQSNSTHFKTQILQLSDTSENTREIKPVTILRCKGWKPGRGGDPPSTSTLVALWQAAEKISRNGPMVAVCNDGVTGCGLYFAMAYLLDRMLLERECDVFLAIRAVRRSRPQFVQSLEQIEILYDVAANYCHYFAVYADCHRSSETK